MTAAPRERLAATLGEVGSPGSFTAQRTAAVDDLHLEVHGLGRLALPVPQAQARQLCRLGRQARYGRGEQTLLDSRVRDTWEIPKSRVKLDKRRWNRTLLPVLDGLCRDLGLPAGCRLKAELHSMLVYAPGQFFVPHQDSEKQDTMVGTLVVTLPSSFKGGALVVEHGGETATYRSSKQSLSFVAFYADCRHQVRPVRSGYRIVLTYNLLLRGETAGPTTAKVPPESVDAVARCLDKHFTARVRPHRRHGDDAGADPPRRLVYLLDHEYTARSLSWSRLKGNDVKRAAVLQAAAESTGCEVFLALAQVHETWSCTEPSWDGWYDRPRYDEDFDGDGWAGDEAPIEPDDQELEELVDWGVTLEWWVDPTGERPEPIKTSIIDSEVCTSTPSANLVPHATEYQGYMGNYGNTMDRWYRRGALVVWPLQDAFAVRAEASPDWALDEIWGRLEAGDAGRAQEMAAAVAPFWRNLAIHEQRQPLLAKALRVAAALDQPALAAMLLKPFDMEMLGSGHVKAMVTLIDSYGETWAGELLAGWFGAEGQWRSSAGPGLLSWVATLHRLCEALDVQGPTDRLTARLLADGSLRWLTEVVRQRLALMPPSRRGEALAELGLPVLALLETTALVDATELRDEALALLCQESDDLLPCLMAALRAAPALPPESSTAAGLDVVAGNCSGRLEARLARPRRKDDDWSIEAHQGCNCDLCRELTAFLIDPARRIFEWPLAQQGRRHVHNMIDRSELPVRHRTRRTGRPYTLVLTKTAEVFEQERQSRLRDQEDMAWLRGRWHSSSAPS